MEDADHEEDRDWSFGVLGLIDGRLVCGWPGRVWVPRHGAVRPTFQLRAEGQGGRGTCCWHHPPPPPPLPVLSTGRAKVAQSSGESTIAVVNISLTCSCINIPCCSVLYLQFVSFHDLVSLFLCMSKFIIFIFFSCILFFLFKVVLPCCFTLSLFAASFLCFSVPFLGPRGPLGTPSSVRPFVRANNINHI